MFQQAKLQRTNSVVSTLGATCSIRHYDCSQIGSMTRPNNNQYTG